MWLILWNSVNKFIFLSLSHTNTHTKINLWLCHWSAQMATCLISDTGWGGVTTGFSIIHLFAAEGIRGLSVLIYSDCTCTILKPWPQKRIWGLLLLAQENTPLSFSVTSSPKTYVYIYTFNFVPINPIKSGHFLPIHCICTHPWLWDVDKVRVDLFKLFHHNYKSLPHDEFKYTPALPLLMSEIVNSSLWLHCFPINLYPAEIWMYSTKAGVIQIKRRDQ